MVIRQLVFYAFQSTVDDVSCNFTPFPLSVLQKYIRRTRRFFLTKRKSVRFARSSRNNRNATLTVPSIALQSAVSSCLVRYRESAHRAIPTRSFLHFLHFGRHLIPLRSCSSVMAIVTRTSDALRLPARHFNFNRIRAHVSTYCFVSYVTIVESLLFLTFVRASPTQTWCKYLLLYV